MKRKTEFNFRQRNVQIQKLKICQVRNEMKDQKNMFGRRNVKKENKTNEN